jgi:acyl-CoA thioesterase II
VRDGKSYCVRKVDVWQGEDQVCFSSICSFKKVEKNFLDAQIPRDIDTEYHDLLKGVKPEDLPLNTNINARNFRSVMSTAQMQLLILPRAAYAMKENYIVKSFPGMITSVLNMEEFHKNQHPLLRRNLYIYSTLDEKKLLPIDPNLEACAHMYHSDRESVWGIVKNFDLLDVLDFAASLSHTIVFHAGPDKLGFRGAEGRRRWFYLETGADRLADGRGLHQGKIFDESGYHVASTMQDGAIRLSSKGDSNDMVERQRKLQINGKL